MLPATRNNRTQQACVQTALLIAALIALPVRPLGALTRIRDIARPLGERTNMLIGYGLVVGLNGTGDSHSPVTTRPLAELLSKLGNAVEPAELKPKNVANVIVTAQLGRNGVREGDKIDVRVHSVSDAKSLAGGTLVLTPLIGSHHEDDRLYGWAQGAVSLADRTVPTSGLIVEGATIEENILHLYVDYETYRGQAVFTLVLDEDHANFLTAKAVADIINEEVSPPGRMGGVEESLFNEPAAMVLGPKNIQVIIPTTQAAYPAPFIARILNLPVDLPEPQASVVINRKAGVIAMTGNVEIAPVIVQVSGLVIQVTDPPPQPLPGQPTVTQTEWARFDTTRSGNGKLQDLIAAMDQLNVPVEDKINAIYTIHRLGVLRANVRTVE